jgi:hypothetical protein
MKLIFSQAATKDLSSDQESPRGNKSVLKTSLSSSLGSITKKRVLFVDQENELASQKSQETDNRTENLPQNMSEVVATSRLPQSAETVAVKSQSSWDSSPLRSPNKPVKFANQSNSRRNSDSDSDSKWGLPR